MLGLADRGQTIALFEAVLKGGAGEALTGFRTLYGYGADPAQVVGDLLEHAHGAAVAKAIGADALGLPGDQAARLGEAGARASAATLSRLWQMLLKAHDEVRRAPDPAAAVEMALIRLCYAADLPSPEEALKALRDGPPPPPSGGGGRAAASGGGGANAYAGAAPARQPAPADAPSARAQPSTVAELMALIEARGDLALKFDVHKFVRPLSVGPQTFRFALAPKAPATLANRLSAALKAWTGQPWFADVEEAPAEAPGGRGLATALAESAYERARRLEREAKAEAAQDPFVLALMAAFPGAELVSVRTREAEPPTAPPEDLAPAPDEDADDAPPTEIGEWAPYEDEE